MRAHRSRTLRITIGALIVALASIMLVVAAIYYFYTAEVQVNVEAPKVIWASGNDITATLGTNKTWCQITISNLEPNATTCYADALNFTVGGNGSSTNGMSLQIISMTDTNNIIWGIRFYVFASGASSTNLTLVDGGNVTISGTNGASSVTAVGYRQSGASSSYGSTSVPSLSGGFTGSANTTYVVAIEVMGKDGILTTQSATFQLKLLWS
jgi:hypothetical protein